MKSILENTMEITQRIANLGDADALLMWRNSTSARSFSQDSEIIPIDQHLSWLSNRLTRLELEPFFVFTLANKGVGMSRLDVVPGSADKYEVSILVDPNQQGKGIGSKILNMTIESFVNEFPKKTITARVHVNNFVSQSLFKKAGFHSHSQVGDFFYFEKPLN